MLIARNGQSLAPLANALLPGDLITFSVGDRIPADIRLITSVSLEIDESALTGETRPSKKNTKICDRGEGEDTHGEGGGKALGERHCMAFMGTLVRSGMSISIPTGRIGGELIRQAMEVGSSLVQGRIPSLEWSLR
jgi:Ca2+-transporting ATPase